MPITETSGYFEAAGYELYASLYRPSVPGPGGLILFEPFGEEKKCALRLMVRLARAAAQSGLTVLRFDLSGTGESAGTHADVTWRQWQRESIAAMRLLRQQPGIVRCTAVGVRLAALLTTTMLNQRKVIEALQEAGIRDQVKVMVGGAPVTWQWATEIGADGYAEDAVGSVAMARQLVGVS